MSEPPDFPQYRSLPVAACPSCLGDCIYEGGDGWRCPACDRTWTSQQVAYFEEGNSTEDD